uniref:Uncharacterized protein n=1 Tax=Molossus molossus TaxID=27622 RepID=A0A7J8CRT5_MOLMO|nr:hypothetical protein HJG59_009808 [Molossus molossus]
MTMVAAQAAPAATSCPVVLGSQAITNWSLYGLVTDKLLVEPLRGPLCGDRDCDNICGWNKTLFIIHINCLLQRIINGPRTKESQVRFQRRACTSVVVRPWPRLGWCGWQPVDVSLSCRCFSLSLPPTLKINVKISLGEG